MNDSGTPDISKLRIPDKMPLKNSPFSSYLKQPKYIIPLTVLLFVVSFFFFWKKSESIPQTSSNIPVSSGPSNFASSPTSSTLSATGYVVAQRSAAVSSKATGRLKELKVVEGDTVKEGDVLGVLENEDLQALLHQSENNLNLQLANEKFAQAELEDAIHQKNRAENLMKTKSMAQSDLDSAISRYKKALAQVDSASANIKLVQAQIEKAKVDLSYTYILAPFDGTVLTKNADVGEIVAPFGSSTNARAAIVTLADMNSLQVEADVSESNLRKIYVGQPCSIVLDSFPDKSYSGIVSKIVPTVDRAKATVLTKIAFVEKDSSIIPEMSAKVSFETKS